MKTTTLILRPEKEASALAALLAEHGLSSLIFSTISIKPLLDEPQCCKIFQNIQKGSHLIFTSVNAVRAVAAALSSGYGNGFQIYAIGSATARALNQLDIDKIFWPQADFCSESLLPLLQSKLEPNAQVYIVTGKDGREWLRQQLELLGIHVHVIACYQRICSVGYDAAVLEKWQRENVNHIVVTSQSALENLWKIVDQNGRKFLSECMIITFSERIARYAVQLGFSDKITICAEASNEGILEILMQGSNRC